MVQTSTAWFWYGNDEDTFLGAAGRNLAIFSLGGLVGGPLLSYVKSYINDKKDPTGEIEVKQAKKKAVVKQSNLARSPRLTNSAKLDRSSF